MNIQEKAEKYASDAWGEYYHDTTTYGTDMSVGEMSAKDYTEGYTDGYNEAKRWIPVGERLPEIVINGRINYVLCNNAGFPFVGQYTGVKSEFHVIGTEITKHVIEWREI